MVNIGPKLTRLRPGFDDFLQLPIFVKKLIEKYVELEASKEPKLG